jgi:hypothetical protein
MLIKKTFINTAIVTVSIIHFIGAALPLQYCIAVTVFSEGAQ